MFDRITTICDFVTCLSFEKDFSTWSKIDFPKHFCVWKAICSTWERGLPCSYSSQVHEWYKYSACASAQLSCVITHVTSCFQQAIRKWTISIIKIGLRRAEKKKKKSIQSLRRILGSFYFGINSFSKLDHVSHSRDVHCIFNFHSSFSRAFIKL